jgi:hypothetical protein
MKTSNVINTLLAQALGPETSEVPDTWTVCIPDGYGSVTHHDTSSLVQASATVNEYLLAGFPAWILDASGNLIHSIATRPVSLN